MENATKALLIAAAVLIVILVIALGMKVFNSAGDVSSQADTVGTQIKGSTESAASSLTESIQGINIGEETSETFNAKFNSLVGSNKTKLEIESLLNSVIANNSKSTHKVSVCFASMPGRQYSDADGIKGLYTTYFSTMSSNSFIIKIYSYDGDGYISCIMLGY